MLYLIMSRQLAVVNQLYNQASFQQGHIAAYHELCGEDKRSGIHWLSYWLAAVEDVI